MLTPIYTIAYSEWHLFVLTNIKDLLQQSKVKRDFPNHFTINGEEITDSNIIAYQFCKYFTDIGPSLAKNIKMPKNINVKDFLTGTHNCTFQFKQIDDILILRIIDDLPNKSSTGFDDISMRLIKAIKTEIIPALTCIFNQSLNIGIFPEKLKIAKVIPIHKKCLWTIYQTSVQSHSFPQFLKFWGN